MYFDFHVFLFYVVSMGEAPRAEEGLTCWSMGGEGFSVARCPPYSTCTTSTWPVFDSLHFRTACSLNILSCFRRNCSSNILDVCLKSLISWVGQEVLATFGDCFFFCWHHLLSVGVLGKSWFWSFHTSNFSSDPTSHWAQLTQPV